MADPHSALRRLPTRDVRGASVSSMSDVALAIGVVIAMTWGTMSAMSEAPEQKTAPAARFATLDDYLAHLAKGGTMDRPYYHLLPDGRYQLIAGRGSNRNPQFFTRDELLRKFGFER